MLLQDKHFNKAQTTLLVLFVIITTLSFLHSPGTSDVNYWQDWAENANTYGLAPGFKTSNADYPPLSTVILLSALKASHLFKTGTFDSVKLSTHSYLSGYALNLNWITTHFLQVSYPAHFGSLSNGEADFIITKSPKLIILPKLFFSHRI